MAGSYDISTVVSRSYIPEHHQESMQKGAENKSAFFMAEFHKETEKKGKTVQKASGAENGTITENAVRRREEERQKQKGRRDKDEKNFSRGGKGLSKVDFTA